MRKLLFLVVILGLIALCVGCQSGLSEAEIRSIVRQEMNPLVAVVATLNTENTNLEQRVGVLEGQLTLLQVSGDGNMEECLGDIDNYIDDLFVYLNAVSDYLDDIHDYLMGYKFFLGSSPLFPPYWSFTSCSGY
ncbi:hypothetical protein ES703_94088 [subsurface metagenome]